MKNVKEHIQFWCLDRFNCADCCCVTDLTVQIDLTIPPAIMIDLNSRCIVVNKPEKNIFSTVSTDFCHTEKYHEMLQVKC